MFSSELDILSQCFSSNSNEIQVQEEEIINGIIVKRIEDLPCQESSLIKAIGYDHENIIFYVVFKNNKTYRYFNTPLSLWERFRTTNGSIGKLYNQKLKGCYKWEIADSLIE